MLASASWADDNDVDDLPPVPATHEVPSSSVAPVEVRRSYAQVGQAVVTREVKAVKPLPPPIQFERPQWTAAPPARKVKIGAPTVVRRSEEFACEMKAPVNARRRTAAIVPVTDIIKCDKCHEERGYLKFTERHVEAQPADGANRLEVGVYCLTCVTLAAPACNKEQCTGKSFICLPDARWPFSLFCSNCVSSYRASLRTQE